MAAVEKLKKKVQHQPSTTGNNTVTEKLNEIVSSMQSLVKLVEAMEKKMERNSTTGQTFPSGYRGRG